VKKRFGLFLIQLTVLPFMECVNALSNRRLRTKSEYTSSEMILIAIQTNKLLKITVPFGLIIEIAVAVAVERT